MEELIVNSDFSLKDAFVAIGKAFKRDRYVRIRLYSSKRTLDQNAIGHAWYPIIEAFMGWTKGYAKNYCKYHYGMPILAQDEDWAPYVKRISQMMQTMIYEERIESMELFTVTSNFDVKQHCAYIDEIQRVFAEQGLILEGKKCKTKERTSSTQKGRDTKSEKSHRPSTAPKLSAIAS